MLDSLLCVGTVIIFFKYHDLLFYFISLLGEEKTQQRKQRNPS